MTIDRNNIQDEPCDLSDLTQPFIIPTTQIYDNNISMIENSTPGMPPLMLPTHFIPNTSYCFSLPISHHVFNIGNIETEADIEESDAAAQVVQHRYFGTVLLPPAQTTYDTEALWLKDNENALPISHHVFNTRITHPNYLNGELTSYIGNIETEAAIDCSHAGAQAVQHRYFETVLLPPLQTTYDTEALTEALWLKDNENDAMEIS